MIKQAFTSLIIHVCNKNLMILNSQIIAGNNEKY